MAEETSSFRWAVGALIALLAAGGGIAALISVFQPKAGNSNNQAQTSPTFSGQASVTPPTNSDSTTVPKTDCKVEGAIYNNQNNQPLPNVRVYLVDKNNNPKFLAANKPNGEFKGDCSEWKPEQFPQKLKIVTRSGFEWTDPETVITQRGKSDINLWVAEIKNPDLTIKRIEVFRRLSPQAVNTNTYQIDQNKPLRINPDVLKRVANKN